MSKNKSQGFKPNNNLCNYKGHYQGQYWQTKNYNQVLYNAFMQQILNLALSRFKWVNLPDTCDARFLEWTLLTQGVATIAHPKGGKHKNSLYSTQATVHGNWNIYDNPTSWQSFGNNGWNFNVTPQNGVLVFDSEARLPLLPILEVYARELVDVMTCKRLNRQHQKIPFIIKGSQDQKLDMINLYKQVDGGEPAIITNKRGIDTIDFEAIQTGVNYLGEPLQAELLNIWQMIYTALGIQNMPFKSERQIEDEVNTQTEPAQMQAISPLNSRRAACKALNMPRFEDMRTKGEIKCVWAHDNASDNFNYLNNLAKREQND